jgi:hypothetical protein
MGWWDIDHRGHMIGDEPADLIGGMLDGLAKDRAGRPLAGLQGVLDALDAVLREPPRELVPERVRGVHARMTDVSRVSSRPGPSDVHLVAALRSGLGEVARVYVDRWQRKPAAVELARALAFVLRAQTERYLADLTSGQLLDLEIEIDVEPPASGWRSFGGGRGLFAEETLDVVLDLFDGLGEPRPSFQIVLDVLATLLGQRLRADLRGGGSIVSAARDAHDERLSSAFAEALAKITAIFASGQDRPPTPAEIANVFCVVLRVPDDYLSDDPAPQLVDILPDV